MSKKSIALILVFLISLGALARVAINYPKGGMPQSQITKQGPSPLSTAKLSLFPNPVVSTATQAASVNIVAQAQVKPSLIQVEMAYDPTILFNVQIIPGNYFTDPEIVLYNIDINTGRISYALKGTPANADANVVATINFTSVNYGLQKETELVFLPKTLVKNNDEVIKLQTTGAKIIVQPTFFKPLPPLSPTPH